jgi:hypothetical protein
VGFPIFHDCHWFLVSGFLVISEICSPLFEGNLQIVFMLHEVTHIEKFLVGMEICSCCGWEERYNSVASGFDHEQGYNTFDHLLQGHKT